jgi:hypothetical protein
MSHEGKPLPEENEGQAEAADTVVGESDRLFEDAFDLLKTIHDINGRNQ